LTVIFEYPFPIHYHELDYNGNVRPVTLLNYLQDAAGMHAKQLGVSVVDLRERGLTWVLSRMHMIFERYPRADDTVLVRTWPSTREGLFSCREFELLDAQGCCAARATTSWAVLDVATRRPVLLDKQLPAYPLLPRRAVEDNFASLPLMPPDAAIKELPFRVQRSDLDINHHVNNTIYAGWALEAVPAELARGALAELEISFRAEALYGESILSRCAVMEADISPYCLHQITKRGGGQELARLRTKWRM